MNQSKMNSTAVGIKQSILVIDEPEMVVESPPSPSVVHVDPPIVNDNLVTATMPTDTTAKTDVNSLVLESRSDDPSFLNLKNQTLVSLPKKQGTMAKNKGILHVNDELDGNSNSSSVAVETMVEAAQESFGVGQVFSSNPSLGQQSQQAMDMGFLTPITVEHKTFTNDDGLYDVAPIDHTGSLAAGIDENFGNQDLGLGISKTHVNWKRLARMQTDIFDLNVSSSH
ncbi:hypothetical protein ACOSQ2_018649 [Xanthoceras sorbifolium]